MAAPFSFHRTYSGNEFIKGNFMTACSFTAGDLIRRFSALQIDVLLRCRCARFQLPFCFVVAVVVSLPCP